MGWHLVFNHLGAIITGSFSTKSRIISNDALPDPTMIPALRVVKLNVPVCNIPSTRFLDSKCFEVFLH